MVKFLVSTSLFWLFPRVFRGCKDAPLFSLLHSKQSKQVSPGQTRLVLSQPSWVGKPIKALCESGHEEGHREPHFLTLSPRYILQHSSPELQGTVGSKCPCFDPHQSVCGYAQLIRARHEGEVSHTFPMLHFPPHNNDSLDFLHPLQCWNFFIHNYVSQNLQLTSWHCRNLLSYLEAIWPIWTHKSS